MDKILLIDGHSILSRAFYGIPLLTDGNGRPTNAVYGFLNILLKAIEDEDAGYLAVSFDLDRKELRRTELYPEYKGNRKPMPEELKAQIPYLQNILAAMQIPIFTMKGYEADDILGTLAKRAVREGFSSVILTGDRDLLQLADPEIKILIPKTSHGKTEVFSYYPEDVVREFGVTPEEFVDLKALMGDSSDNIPGLPGVGPKTAADLIRNYHTIENVRAHAEEVRPPRAQKALMEHYDLAVLSKVLAKIDTEVPIEADLRKGRTDAIYTEEALNLLRDLELRTLTARFAAKVSGRAGNGSGIGGGEQGISLPEAVEITGRQEIRHILQELEQVREAGLSLFAAEGPEEPQQLSLFDAPKKNGPEFAAAAVSFDGKLYLLKSSDLYDASGFLSDLEETLKKHGKDSDRSLLLSVPDKKQVLKILPGAENLEFFDCRIAAYLLNPLREDYDYDILAKDYLSLTLSGRKELSVKKEAFSEYCLGCEAFVCAMAASVLRSRLSECGMEHLYYDIELPLAEVLKEFETVGIRTDKAALSAYSESLKLLIEELEQKIYEEAGEIFNINSPLQLGNILFEKLGIKGGKKTKKGYSTAADVLTKLAPDVPVVRDILLYRTYSKLRSTYAEGLKAYIAPDGRIHGTFHQTVTATGRISSADPNLQNIPVRTEAGREIRKVFIPSEGYVFTDADYSQVELRILAALSGDEKLISAYRNSQDIHALTASQVFHVDLRDVTPEMRRNAKAVNFGIVYGISAFGLGEDLSISRKEALTYIDRYFETYPKVKEYLDSQVAFAKEYGYTRTLFGRRRPVPELKSSNYMERSFGERVAMNAPIQGTAADIMKIAMNRVSRDLKPLKSRLILQIHDELLVETWPPEEEEVRRILKEDMEKAVELPVPLTVEVKTGTNWNECH